MNIILVGGAGDQNEGWALGCAGPKGADLFEVKKIAIHAWTGGQAHRRVLVEAYPPALRYTLQAISFVVCSRKVESQKSRAYNIRLECDALSGLFMANAGV